MNAEKEQQFIEALRQGDASAFQELVTLFKKRVYNSALSILQHEEDAEDTTQEVFIAIYSSIHQFKGDSSLSTWIYRITITRSLDLLRKYKRQKRWGIVKRLLNSEDEADKINVQSFQHPGIQLEQKEKAAILFKVIQSLPDNQRIAFTLCQVEDLSYKEISAVMELSESSVESLLHRAKQNLRKKLQTYYKNDK